VEHIAWKNPLDSSMWHFEKDYIEQDAEAATHEAEAAPHLVLKNCFH
jgi:hypothetical protein